MNYDDIIQHHGVKGMRWGVRKMYENHKENLRYKYRKKGLSEEDVEKKLKRRLAAEKIGLAAAGLALAGYGAYKGKNYLQDEYLGRTLKNGSTIDTVTAASKLDKDRPIYAAFGKVDKLKYRGLYAEERERKRALATDMQRKIYGLGNHDNIMKLKANKDVKIAPNKTAREVFSNLYNNDQSFNRAANEIALFRGGVAKGAYDKFNVGLTGRQYNEFHKKQIDKFYGALKEKGFSGVMDMNDKKYSGYNTKNPTIFFDHQNLGLSKLSKITTSNRTKDAAIGKAIVYPRIIANEFAPAIGLAGAAVAAKKLSNARNRTKTRENDVEYNRKYRKKV